jgi:hypothetical protein
LIKNEIPDDQKWKMRFQKWDFKKCDFRHPWKPASETWDFRDLWFQMWFQMWFQRCDFRHPWKPAPVTDIRKVIDAGFHGCLKVLSDIRKVIDACFHGCLEVFL